MTVKSFLARVAREKALWRHALLNSSPYVFLPSPRPPMRATYCYLKAYEM